jgi:dienelactone hydrolase
MSNRMRAFLPWILKIWILGIWPATCCVDVSGQNPSPPVPALSRDQLMAYRDSLGAVREVTNVGQWDRRRHSILIAMQSVMGTYPPRPLQIPTARLIDEVDCGSYVRRLIEYQSQPNAFTPAYLCVPKQLLTSAGGRAPAVLCLHPTDNSVGHDVVVGLGGKANRQYASELAERGYVTLAPSYPLLAKYQPDLTQLGWSSGTLKAVWDNVRGLDYLQSLSFVRGDQIGAIGHSLGGHNSVYTAVFDDRIRVIVSSCGLDRYRDYYGGDPERWRIGKGWTSTRYMPRLADYAGRLQEVPFDFPEMIAALAPRHTLIIAPLHDSNFQAASVDRVVESAQDVYRLYGHAERLTVEHPDCGHDFPDEMREQAYELFDRVLK